MYLTVSFFSMARVQFPTVVEYLKEFFPDHTDHTHPEQAWQKTAQYPLNVTTQPVDIEEGG